MSPHIARQVVSFFHRSPSPKPERALTAREHEVLDLLIVGKSYKDIAQHLGVSVDTVRSHVRKVYDKLHIHSRTEVILKFGGKV
jgi:DNA-binding NarL/FixJ family response regulator